MVTTRPVERRCYRVGEVAFSVSSALPDVLEEHAALYAGFGAEDSGDGAPIRIHVTPTPRSLVHRRRYLVSINDRIQFEPARRDALIPYLEWAVNWEVPRAYPEFLSLHASSLSRDGVGLVLPGDSGSGKSTLTAALVSRGWQYLCDEFALVHTKDGMLHPFPRAICLKRPSFPVLERAGMPMSAPRFHFKGAKGYVGFVNPQRIRPNATGAATKAALIVFPRFEEGQSPSLTPISRGEAAFMLHRVAFNLLGCSAVGLDVIARLVRRCRCYRLASGDIAETCSLIEDLVHGDARDC